MPGIVIEQDQYINTNLSVEDTEEPCYNNSICLLRFCREKEFAAMKNPNMYQYDKR